MAGQGAAPPDLPSPVSSRFWDRPLGLVATMLGRFVPISGKAGLSAGPVTGRHNTRADIESHEPTHARRLGGGRNLPVLIPPSMPILPFDPALSPAESAVAQHRDVAHGRWVRIVALPS